MGVIEIIAGRVEAMSESVERIDHTLHGNGRPGLVRELQEIQTLIKAQQEWIRLHDVFVREEMGRFLETRTQVAVQSERIQELEEELKKKTEGRRWIIGMVISLAAVAVAVLALVK